MGTNTQTDQQWRHARGKDPVSLRKSAMVHAEDLYKGYGSKLILDNIDLSVRAGEFVSLVGPSGCGKSTLLRLILGQELPDRGILNIEGEPADFADRTRGIVFQRYSLYPHLTVLRNVMEGMMIQRSIFRVWKDYAMIKERAMTYLKTVNLQDHAGKYPHELSGGMCQRVAIAQALILEPKILLMDEPFGALDPSTREGMQVFLLELWEKTKMTIVFVTHDLEEAVFLGTRLVALSQYYIDDRPEGSVKGAKIINDLQLPSRAQSTDVKLAPWFAETVRYVRSGFDPASRKHITDFDLRHPDSFQTFAVEETQVPKN